MSKPIGEQRALEDDFETAETMLADLTDRWGADEVLAWIKTKQTELCYRLNICDQCGRRLQPPVSEDRGGGYSELVVYCGCGNTIIYK